MLSDISLPILAPSGCPLPLAATSKEPIRKPISETQDRFMYPSEDDISVQSLSVAEYTTFAETHEQEPALVTNVPDPLREKHGSKEEIEHLPSEILELIIGPLVGTRGPTSSDTLGANQGTHNWSTVMRHPRRKQLSDLALVSRSWRRLIQERLYRHIKVKGTKAELEECADWFLTHAHLGSYVRHIEVWVPVWEIKGPPRSTLNKWYLLGSERPQGSDRASLWQPLLVTMSNTQPGQVNSPLTTQFIREETNNISLAYQQASQNATLEEIFGCVMVLFPAACALTIEGGHCKKSPKIQDFREAKFSFPDSSKTPPSSLAFEILHAPTHPPRTMPTLPHITTLVLKGAWNIIRQNTDFQTIASALPNLREWHCTYSKPKTDAYTAICAVLSHNIPPTLTHLNICLEGLHHDRPPTDTIHKWRKLYPAHHVCFNLGLVAPLLETLTYTGRICGSVFTAATNSVAQTRRGSRLRYIDLIVTNCCRLDATAMSEGTGVFRWAFIQRFEDLVTEAVRSLPVHPHLQFLRIRFIDLDSPGPLIHPYFLLKGKEVSGIWNEEILKLLAIGRQDAKFEDLDEGSGGAGSSQRGFVESDVDGKGWMGRPKSINVERYWTLTHPTGSPY